MKQPDERCGNCVHCGKIIDVPEVISKVYPCLAMLELSIDDSVVFCTNWAWDGSAEEGE